MRKNTLAFGMVPKLVLLTSASSRAQLEPYALFAACKTTAGATLLRFVALERLSRCGLRCSIAKDKLLLDKATIPAEHRPILQDLTPGAEALRYPLRKPTRP